MNLVPVTQLAEYLRRPDAPARVMATDCEWFRCPGCAKRGYGVDSWHPLTAEFWGTHRGRLMLHACKACRSDLARNRRGFVPEELAVERARYGAVPAGREAMAA